MSSVKEVQLALCKHGFNPGPVDGVLGTRTKSAIIRFKQSIGYKSTAYIGPLTKAALFDDRKERAVEKQKTRPDWLRLAFSYLGVKEYSGPKHNPQIIKWWLEIESPFKDDETPWCAAFVGGVLEESDIQSTRSSMARSYEGWGEELAGPAVGAVVVFWRNNPRSRSGHVGFVVGRDLQNRLLVLGGNQSNEVSVKAFELDRVLSYHWPLLRNEPFEIGFDKLPVIDFDGESSNNEQ